MKTKCNLALHYIRLKLENMTLMLLISIFAVMVFAWKSKENKRYCHKRKTIADFDSSAEENHC